MEHLLKFLVVGTVGFIINTAILVTGVRLGLRPSFAGPLGAELAIISNFFWNNIWTFSDRQITSWNVLPAKFLQFNILSFGSVVIQFIFLKAGESIFGLTKFKEPFIDQQIFTGPLSKIKIYSLIAKLPTIRKFSLYLVFYLAGVGAGLVWNFLVYSQVIWR